MNCTKSNIAKESEFYNSDSQTSYVKECNTGYHWDNILKKCVQDCSSGYHNDQGTGACVVYDVDTLTVIANTNNPQDIAGKNHNNGMYSIMPKYENGSLEPTEHNVNSNRNSYLTSLGYTTSSITKIDSIATSYYGDMYKDTSMTWTINTSYQKGLISFSAKNYLIQLSTSVYNFFKDSFAIPTQSQYNTFANNLVTIENQVKVSTTISESDKNCILASYAVGRYSALYNINYSIKKSSSVGVAVARVAPGNGWFNLKDVVGDDVAGAMGGAIAGAGVALYTGGTMGPLVVEGAIGWGLGCSGYGAAKQVWNHFFN